MNFLWEYVCCINFKMLKDSFILDITGYCGDPGTPSNGRRTLTGTTQGHTVTYTCNTGYKILGSSRRTCLSNGQWSGSTAQCPSKNSALG